MIEEFVIAQGLVLHVNNFGCEGEGALVTFATIEGKIKTSIFLYAACDDLTWMEIE